MATIANRGGEEQTEPEALHLDESQIEIGERVRTDRGDIESLAESIKLLGLLHPVVVRRLGSESYKLVAGYRRILALRLLAQPVPVIVTTNIEDELMALQAERDENIERKDFPPDEALVMRDLIIEAEGLAEQAKQREAEGLDRGRRRPRRKPGSRRAAPAFPAVRCRRGGGVAQSAVVALPVVTVSQAARHLGMSPS
jgi:ParB family chromosome partitioning protein